MEKVRGRGGGHKSYDITVQVTGQVSLLGFRRKCIRIVAFFYGKIRLCQLMSAFFTLPDYSWDHKVDLLDTQLPPVLPGVAIFR